VTAALVFTAYAVVTGYLVPAALRRRWAARSPRLAMSLWLALPASWIVAATLAVLAVTVPFPLSWPSDRHDGGHGLLAGPALPGGTILAAAGLFVAAAVILRAGACLAGELARGRRERHEHASFVAAAGRPDRALGAVILDDDTPAAYCLPSRRDRIVVSSGALAVLTPRQLQAVLAHEGAHLRGRHHLALTIASALGRAFPRVPLLVQAVPELAVLAEMAADDAAARRHSRDDLAEALVILARAGVRSAALTAGGPAAIARIQRLLAPPQSVVAARLAAAAGLILPAAIACLPLVIAACDVASWP
jgi:Zn-dependent protease with chaperone function